MKGNLLHIRVRNLWNSLVPKGGAGRKCKWIQKPLSQIYEWEPQMATEKTRTLPDFYNWRQRVAPSPPTGGLLRSVESTDLGSGPWWVSSQHLSLSGFTEVQKDPADRFLNRQLSFWNNIFFFGNCSFTVQPSAYHSANYDCQLGNGDVCPVETSWDHIWILKHRYFLLCKVRPFFFLGLFRLQTVNSFLTSSYTLSLVESLIPSPLWLFPDLYLQGFSTKDTEKNHRCSRPHPRPSKSVSVGGAQSWIFFKIIPGCFQQPDWEPGLAGCYRISPPPEPLAHHLSATWGISLPYPHLSTPSTPLPPSHVRYSLMILAELTVPVNNAGSLCCLLSTVNSQEKRTCCKNVVPCWGLAWWSSS